VLLFIIAMIIDIKNVIMLAGNPDLIKTFVGILISYLFWNFAEIDLVE